MYDNSPLPKKASDLIMLALGDLKKCRNDPGYVIHFDYYHDFSEENETCIVGFAGAVMAQTLGVAPGCVYEPSHFNHHAIWRKLEGLEYLRKRDIKNFFHYLDIPNNQNLEDEINSVFFNLSKKHITFEERMTSVAETLKARGY